MPVSEIKPAAIKTTPMKTHKTNIMRGVLFGIVAFTSLASSDFKMSCEIRR